MTLLIMVGTAAFGFLLAVGIETEEGWRPPIRWFGWRDVHPLVRCLAVLLASWLLQGWLTADSRPHGAVNAVLAGLSLLQVLLGLAGAGHILRWLLSAHAARTLLRNAGLTDPEIHALQAVNERSRVEELLPALSGFAKLGDRVAAVQAAFAASRTQPAPEPASAPAAGHASTTDRVYNISDLVRYYVLSGKGETPGVWRDCYQALCRAYRVPPDWERDQAVRMRGNEWRDQETAPEQRPYNLMYADYRLAFERVRLKPMGLLVGPGEGELDQAVYRRLIHAIASLDEPLRELDLAFFAGVYDAPAALTLTETTLVVQYAFPDSATQTEEWAASL